MEEENLKQVSYRPEYRAKELPNRLHAFYPPHGIWLPTAPAAFTRHMFRCQFRCLFGRLPDSGRCAQMKLWHRIIQIAVIERMTSANAPDRHPASTKQSVTF